MIRFVENKDIDRTRWDALIYNAPNGNIFSLSWYLDAVCHEWHAVIKGDYDAILAVPTKKIAGIRTWYQPFFSRQLAIITNENTADGLFRDFFSVLPKSYKAINIGLTGTEKLILPGLEISEYIFQQLDLDRPYEEIRNNYAVNTKRILKKLCEDKTVVLPIEDPGMVANLFMDNKANDLAMTGAELEPLRRLMAACEDRGQGEAFGLYNNNRLLAAGFFMYFRSEIIYLKGASTEEGRKCGAMYGLMDHVIRTATESTVLDFGGSRIENIAAFFRKFGAKDHSYLFLNKELPFFLNLGKKLYRKLY